MVLTMLLLAAGQTRLPPVDEGLRDPSFAAFRAQFQDAVRQKDAKSLLQLVDPHIRSTFGGGDGVATFRKEWMLDVKVSPLWKELASVLALGSAREGKGYWAPYLYGKWPQDLDPFENAVAMGKAVPLFEKPGGKVIESLDYDIVRRQGPPISQTWSKVVSPTKKAGYIRNADLRSQVGYRAFFEKKGNAWKMTAFLSGD